MSYIANQYNHATPLSSTTSLFGESVAVQDKKYFTLFDNVLDGSYVLIDGDVGIWGSSVAGADGILPTPFVLTVKETLTLNAIRVVGSSRCYPVDFTIKLYDGTWVLQTFTITGNNAQEYVHYLPRTYEVTQYEITVTRVSAPSVAVIYNSYNPGYIKRSDAVTAAVSDVSEASSLHDMMRVDALLVTGTSRSTDIAFQSFSSDALPVSATEARTYNIGVSVSDTLPTRVINEGSEVVNSMLDEGDTANVRQVGTSSINNTIEVTTDALKTKLNEDTSHVINDIDSVNDVCPVNVVGVAKSSLDNIHSAMKKPSRRIYGKVYITYTDPMLSSETSVESSGAAYNSVPMQILDSSTAAEDRFFRLYDNDLTGNYVVSDDRSQVGWVSKQLSNADGTFDTAPYMRISFSERPITDLQVIFDAEYGAIATDFHVDYVQADGNTVRRSFTDNDQGAVTITDTVARVVAIVITIIKVSKPGYPASILEVPTLSTRLYAGYENESQLVSIDLLEELTYEDEIEALGGISANEVTVKLDNSKGEFFFNNPDSVVASSLRRNRKIVPWLGVELIPGEIEWYTLGTFWSYKWDVPVESLVATVVGFDTLGLLDTTSFTKHVMQMNKSLGQLVEYILDDAKQSLSFIEHLIDPALYDIIIPYAWFAAGSHTEALRKLSLCYPMHIYCDRDGAICAAPQKLHLDYHYDTWSDSTNVISKKYSSLHTTLPNIINVEVKNPTVVADTQLATDSLTFNVSQISTRTLNFSKPYISDIRVDVTCDASVAYSYEVYSWGIVLNFTGSGIVYGISCTGTTLDVSNSASISRRDDNSIRLNGAISRDISSDFIQTSEHAIALINRLASLSEQDKYDVEVTYRGDIALTINDPILLLDGLAPDNRYNIKRHELFWNGGLSGVAHLNT